MSTDIAYLQDLRADLMKAAARTTTAPGRAGRVRTRLRRPVARWKLAGALAAATIVVSGGVGLLAVGGPGVPFAADARRSITDPVGKVNPEGRLGILHGGLARTSTIGSGSDRYPPVGYSLGPDTPWKATDADRAETSSTVDGVPVIGPNIVKTGALELEVDRHTFATQFQKAMAIAERFGGYVQTSATSGTKTRSGTMTMRVPADEFALAVGDLRRLGTVLHQEVSGVDVTAQFVDLGARLRNAEAQEASLRKLLAKAPSVDATLRVNRVLSDTELKIEELQGQLRVLESRADLGTIHLLIEERGAAAVVPPADDVQNPEFGKAFRQSVAGFLGVLSSVVVGLGYVLPILVAGLVAWFVVRRIRRSRVATA